MILPSSSVTSCRTVHIDIKHLPKLQTSNRDRRKRYLFVAIDRCSRSVHLAVKDDETEKGAIAFLHEAAAAFPFRLTHVLTDNGSCFTPAFAKACTSLGAQYRHTKPRTPQMNGMVERFNGRVASEVLDINVYSRRALEQLLRGFNTAYNARRQRVLDGKRQTKLQPNTSQPNPNSLTRRRTDAPDHATQPKHDSSLTLPRRSHNQTRTRQAKDAGATIWTFRPACDGG